MLQKIFTLLLTLITPFQFAFSDTRLNKISNIKIQYQANSDIFNLSWNKVRNAKKYAIKIFDQNNSEVLKLKLSKSSHKIKSKLLNEGHKYNINIKAIGNSSFKASKSSKKTFYVTMQVSSEEIIADFTTTNSGGRKGQYFLPENYRQKTLPLMIAFHGSSISGSNMINAYKKLARQNDFIIFAPDSTNPAGWYLSDDYNDPSVDQIHFYNLYQELLSLPQIKIDSSKVLISGTSAGGSLAALLGSHDSVFTHIAVIHGGVYIEDLGTNRVPFWLSTGSEDTLRTPSELKSYAEALKLLNFPLVSYMEYPVPHQVPDDEKQDLISWWLN